MVDFSNIKSIEIPEGTVKQISRSGTIIWQNVSIPSEYQQVEYIQSSGSQYINTGIVGTQKVSVDISFAWVNYTNSWVFAFMAMAQSSDGNWYGLSQATAQRNTRLALGTNGTAYTNVVYNDFTKHNYKISDFKITVDNANTYSISGTNNFSTVYPIVIFANNKANSITQYSSIRLYSMKMYNNNELVRDFVPCYRKNDTVIGLYDLVSKTFFTNSGSGNFTKGGNV